MKKLKTQKTAAEKVYETFISHESLLDEREKDILTKYYGFGSNTRHTLEEIGKHYKLSRERIRQIKHYAIKKISGDDGEKTNS
jgi:RNA polymerase primary sigma factor